MNNMNVKDYLLNIISPPRCLSCNYRMESDSKALFCRDCGKDYHLNNGIVCEMCGRPIHENRDTTCSHCKTEKRWYIRNISKYKYKGSIKTAIQNMKFKKRAWIAFDFGRSLCKTVKSEYSDIKFDMILYVPMSPLREVSRGFNQSFEIAEIISEQLKIPLEKNNLQKARCKNTKRS